MVNTGMQMKYESGLLASVLSVFFKSDVLANLTYLSECFKKHQYGALSIDPERYSMFVITSRQFKKDRQAVLITACVHGFETSSVMEALTFLRRYSKTLAERFNFIIAPCLSPWSYETLNRFSPNLVDVNRSFLKALIAKRLCFL